VKQTITVDGVGKVVLTDQDYLAAGGEASVYVKGNMAYKLYHDPARMIPLDKIKELSAITNTNVLKPKHILYDNSGTALGYAMDFKKDTHPICKLFTRSFKQKMNISNQDITEFIEEMQKTVVDIHNAKCLIVDMNEMNILSSNKFDFPYYIDVDSYQTPSHKATAIMESIRDRLIKNNKWTENSDWFSFAVIAFQLWIGIHPYKGTHPKYKPNEWIKRMEDGVSVFEKDISLPSVCNDFSVIPASHLEWFKEIFGKNKRFAPPEIGDVIGTISIPSTFNIKSASEAFITAIAHECPETIKDIFTFMGIPYMMTNYHVYKAKQVLPVEVDSYDKVLVCESNSITSVICKMKDRKISFETEKGVPIGSINANGMMYRNGCIYSVANEKLIENSFAQFGEKVIHATKQVGNVLDLSTQMFDGVIFQDLLGRIHITIPYEKGKCKILHIPELDGYRILDARSEKNICGVMVEKKGSYHRFMFTFSPDYSTYKVRISNDVPYEDINLTVLPNGVAVLATNTEVEVFKDESVKVIDHPPFNSNTKLFNVSGGICYIDGNKVYSTKIKK